MLTAKDSLQNKEEGYQAGADSYLTKPFSASLLRSRIYNLLESRRKLAKPVVTYGKKEQSDFAAVLFDGFTDDEIAAFERYHIKILDNINRKRSDK